MLLKFALNRSCSSLLGLLSRLSARIYERVNEGRGPAVFIIIDCHDINKNGSHFNIYGLEQQCCTGYILKQQISGHWLPTDANEDILSKDGGAGP